MKSLIRRDFIVTYSNKSPFYILLFMVPLLLFLTDNFDTNLAFMYSVLTFCFISTRIPFSYEIKDKPHLFIQSLPVTKVDIVISKYLSVFINFLIGSVFTFIYIFILDLLGFIDLTGLNFTTTILTLIGSLVFVSLSLPAEFMFTPKVSNFVNLFIYISFLNIFIIGDSPILDFLNLFSDYRIGAGLAVALIYFVSMGISIVLYKNRKFY